MHQNSQTNNMMNWLLGLAAFVIIVAGLRAAQPLIVPFLIAAFLAVLCAPTLQWLQEKGISTTIALILVIFGVSALFLIVVAVVGASINDFSRQLGTYSSQLTLFWQQFIEQLKRLGIAVPENVSEGSLNPKRIILFFGSLLNSLGSVLSNAFVVLLTFVFIMLEAAGIPKKLANAFGGETTELARFHTMGTAIRHYISIKTWVSLATAGLVAGWLKLLGVEYVMLWAMLAFFFNYVPNIGSIIAAVPAVLLALIQPQPAEAVPLMWGGLIQVGGGVNTAIFTALGYIAVNVVVGNVIEPRIMGRGLGLSTLVVFLSLAFWGWVFGPVGMLFSVPLTMIFKIGLEASEQTRWLSVLLGSDTPENIPADQPLDKTRLA